MLANNALFVVLHGIPCWCSCSVSACVWFYRREPDMHKLWQYCQVTMWNHNNVVRFIWWKIQLKNSHNNIGQLFTFSSKLMHTDGAFSRCQYFRMKIMKIIRWIAIDTIDEITSVVCSDFTVTWHQIVNNGWSVYIYLYINFSVFALGWLPGCFQAVKHCGHESDALVSHIFLHFSYAPSIHSRSIHSFKW